MAPIAEHLVDDIGKEIADRLRSVLRPGNARVLDIGKARRECYEVDVPFDARRVGRGRPPGLLH